MCVYPCVCGKEREIYIASRYERYTLKIIWVLNLSLEEERRNLLLFTRASESFAFKSNVGYLHGDWRVPWIILRMLLVLTFLSNICPFTSWPKYLPAFCRKFSLRIDRYAWSWCKLSLRVNRYQINLGQRRIIMNAGSDLVRWCRIPFREKLIKSLFSKQIIV